MLELAASKVAESTAFDNLGSIEIESEPRELRRFGGRDYVMEEAIVGDFALVKAWKGDTRGNLVFRGTSRNFNADAATAGKVCIAEVEETGTMAILTIALLTMPLLARCASPRWRRSWRRAISTPTRSTCRACTSTASSRCWATASEPLTPRLTLALALTLTLTLVKGESYEKRIEKRTTR